MSPNKNNIVDVLRAEYDEWVASLSSEEKHAIRKYSYNSLDTKGNRFFERLNAMLRGAYNKKDVDVLARYSDIISTAISKHPLQIEIECYRGTDVDATIGLADGTEFILEQFTSTSVIRSKALEKDYLYVIKVPIGARGAYIERISAFPSQREFLLDKSCKYRLLKRSGKTVYLEVLV